MMRSVLSRVILLAVSVGMLSGCGDSKPTKPASSGPVTGTGDPGKAGPSLPAAPKGVE